MFFLSVLDYLLYYGLATLKILSSMLKCHFLIEFINAFIQQIFIVSTMQGNCALGNECKEICHDLCVWEAFAYLRENKHRDKKC